MKASLRIPTTEQYAYIEVEIDAEPDEIVATHDHFTNLVKNKDGIADKEYRALIDQYMQNDTIEGDPGITEQLSKAQNYALQVIKKSKKRTYGNNGNKQ